MGTHRPLMVQKVFTALILTSSLALPLFALAQTAPTTACGVIRVIQDITSYFATIVFIIAVIILLYTGFLFLTGGGNEDTQKKARTFLIYGLIGIAIALLAYNATAIVKSIVGSSVVTQCGLGV